jgi:very-short-patch-repair endonuclease
MKNLEDETARMRAAVYERQIGVLDRMSASLESPIERALFWALLDHVEHEVCGYWDPSDTMNASGPASISHDVECVDDSDLWRRCQAQLHCQKVEGRYRLDLAIVVSEGFADHGDVVRVAIECDGHDFHEKTKEQAARDKKRDRDLQHAGWAVLRFTGSQIYGDAAATAAEVWRFVDARVLEIRKRQKLRREGSPP